MSRVYISVVAIVAISGGSFYYLIKRIRQRKRKSKYESAVRLMGFCGYEKDNGGGCFVELSVQQEALLKQLQIAGYFQPSRLWNDLSQISNIKNKEKVFRYMHSVIKQSKADQPDPKLFDAKYLRKYLFECDDLDLDDCLDIILYLSQHAFNRSAGQERNELKSEEWMTKYEKEYLEQAAHIGLIDRKLPKYKTYDSIWIAGASRIGVIKRFMDYNYYVKLLNVCCSGDTLILAGNRELWADIDGIGPKIMKLLDELKIDDDSCLHKFNSLLDYNYTESREEGKAYLLYLANKYNIQLNKDLPLIKYETQSDCPKGRFPNRVYCNYADNEDRRLTETLLCDDLISKYLLKSNENSNVKIVDTISKNGDRPNTESTVEDAARLYIQDIINNRYGAQKSFKILLISNNPYIERQTLVTQRKVNDALKLSGLDKQDYKITVEGVGSANKQSPIIIHSEFAALMAQKWLSARELLKPKRDIKELLFQTRPKPIENKTQTYPKQLNLFYSYFDNFKYFLDTIFG